MKGQVSEDTAVGVPAAVIWEVYRGLGLGRLIENLLGDVLGKFEVLEGDGDVGSIVKLVFPPGTPGAGYMTEKFTKIDDEKRIKETETIDGGYLALGFDSCGITLEIIEKDSESCIIRSTINYEADTEKLANIVSTISTEPLAIMAQAIEKHFISQQTASST
ncbi:hypothetical protein ACFE04_028130 [Oxalis oulophora]